MDLNEICDFMAPQKKGVLELRHIVKPFPTDIWKFLLHKLSEVNCVYYLSIDE